MVKLTKYIPKLKTELFTIVSDYHAMMENEKDKQVATIVEHLKDLIAQIPSSHGVITPDRESIFSAKEKIEIYVDNLDTGGFNNPKKILVERIKKVLINPEYSFRSLYKELISYMETRELELNALNSEFTRVLTELENREVDLLEIKDQKEKTEHWLMDVQQEYAMNVNQLKSCKQELDGLQEQLEKKSSEVAEYNQMIAKKKQIIQKLKRDKKKEYSKQEKLAKKIKEINHKIDNKSHRVINFEGNVGVPVQDKLVPLDELDVGLEELEAELKELQQEKLKSSEDIQSLTLKIEKGISENKSLKDNLRIVERQKADLEQARTLLQGELEQLKKYTEHLKTELNQVQGSLDNLQKTCDQLVSQERVLQENCLVMQTRLNEEEEKNEVLIEKNKDKEKHIAVTKENLEKLKLKLEDQGKKFKEQLKNQAEELEQDKKSHRNKEQSFKEQLLIANKQIKNLESKIKLREDEKINSEDEFKLFKQEMGIKITDLESLTEENSLLREELESIKLQLKGVTQQKEEFCDKWDKQELRIRELTQERDNLESQNKKLIERMQAPKNSSPPQSPQKSGKFPFFKQDNPVAGGSEPSIPQLGNR